MRESGSTIFYAVTGRTVKNWNSKATWNQNNPQNIFLRTKLEPSQNNQFLSWTKKTVSGLLF